jgi:hypothetical protein
MRSPILKTSCLLLTGVVLSICSCSQPKGDIKKFSWLSGKWSGNYGEMVTYEDWDAEKNNTMMGRGGIMSGTDTMFAEKIRIEQREDELYYIAKVPGNPAPVDFKFTGFVNDSAIFENPQHDFPQRVVYFRKPDGSLYAKIDGKSGSRYRKEEFNFKKTQ